MKKGFTLVELLAVIVILAIISFITVPIVIDIINDTKESVKLKNIQNIEKAAKLYAISESNLSDEEIKKEITIRQLIDLGYIEDAESEILDKKVFIKLVNNEYDIYYEGRDMLGDYSTLKELIEKNNNIKKNVKINGNIVNKIYGTKDEQLTMKNYVLYSGQLFEVLETNDTNSTIKLVSAVSLTSISYGETNDFSTSWVKKWLNEVFLGSLERKDIIKNTEFCIDDIDVVPSEYTKMDSCTNKISEKVGLLTYEDYIYAKDGETIQDGGSYLDEGELSWLITPTTLATTQIWHINHTSHTTPSNLLTTTHLTNSFGQGVRPVISIRDDVLVKSGSGTRQDPYILSVERSLDKNQKLNLGKVGDYVYMDESNNPYVEEIEETYISKVINKTPTDKVRYRIVNINSDGSIKLERVDVLRNLPSTISIYKRNIPFYSLDSGEGATSCLYDATQKYGTDTISSSNYYLGGCRGHNIFNPEEGEGDFVINTGENIGYYLNNADNSFYNWYSAKAKRMIIKTKFLLDTAGYGKNYSNLNDGKSTTYPNRTNDGIVEVYVGLPYWGEMYTGNDLNISYMNINRWGSDLHVSGVTDYGYGFGTYPMYAWIATRPIITISPEVFVKEGNGTANSPYVLDI